MCGTVWIGCRSLGDKVTRLKKPLLDMGALMGAPKPSRNMGRSAAIMALTMASGMAAFRPG